MTREHVDTSFLTFLTTFHYPGLQVEINGDYKSIRPVKNSIIVNLGEIFSRMTNYRVKATMHRILDIGISRYSSPFFFEPAYYAEIPT